MAPVIPLCRHRAKACERAGFVYKERHWSNAFKKKSNTRGGFSQGLQNPAATQHIIPALIWRHRMRQQNLVICGKS